MGVPTMSHIGLGQLLRDFNIEEAADYYLLPPGRQSVFLSRLYSELEDHAKEGLGLLKLDRGLKLHFVVESDGQGSFRNLPDDVFFRKICFYASHAVVTFPFRETDLSPREVVHRGHATEIKRNKEVMTFGKYRTERDGYGGRVEEIGKAHHLYRSELDIFLHLLCTARPFLESKTKFLTIVPSYYPEAEKLKAGKKSALGLSPANFKLAELRQQFEEEGFEQIDSVGTPTLYLPYFSGLSSEDVLKVREEEKDRYASFQTHLVELLHGLPQVKSERELLAWMGMIDKELHQINLHCEAISKAARNRNFRYALGLGTILMGLVHPPIWAVPVVSAITTILGKDDFTFFKFLGEKRTHDAQLAEAVGNELYLHWRLEDPRHHRKLPPVLASSTASA